MSNSEPSAIVLQGIRCMCGLYKFRFEWRKGSSRFAAIHQLAFPSHGPRAKAVSECPNLSWHVQKRTTRTNISHIKSLTMWRLELAKRNADIPAGRVRTCHSFAI